MQYFVLSQACRLNLCWPKETLKEEASAGGPEEMMEVQDEAHETNPRRCNIAASRLRLPLPDLDRHGDMYNTNSCNSGCTYSLHFQFLCLPAACRCSGQTWSFHNHTGNASWSKAPLPAEKITIWAIKFI